MRRSPSKSATSPARPTSALSGILSYAPMTNSMFDIPVEYDACKGKLPLDADINAAIAEFIVALGKSPPVALVRSLASPTFPRIASLLFWITLVTLFRDEPDVLPPYRTELAHEYHLFDVFVRARGDHSVLRVVPFLLGQMIFRIIVDLFPQALPQFVAVAHDMVECVSITCHYELCGFYAQKKTIRVLRRQYFSQDVVDFPQANLVKAAKRRERQHSAGSRPSVDGRKMRITGDDTKPELSFGNVHGVALAERSVSAVLEESEVSERMKEYLNIIKRGQTLYGQEEEPVVVGNKHDFRKWKKATRVIQMGNSVCLSEMKRRQHQNKLAWKIAAFTMNRNSELQTTWLSPSGKLIYGHEGDDRAIPGKTTSDAFRLSMRTCPTQDKLIRPQTVDVAANYGQIDAGHHTVPADQLTFNHAESASSDSHSLRTSARTSKTFRTKNRRGGIPSRRSAGIVKRVHGPTPGVIVLESPERLSAQAQALRRERSVKAMRDHSWGEFVKNHDAITGAKRQWVDPARLHKEEQTYLNDVGSLVAVSIRPMTR